MSVCLQAKHKTQNMLRRLPGNMTVVSTGREREGGKMSERRGWGREKSEENRRRAGVRGKTERVLRKHRNRTDMNIQGTLFACLCIVTVCMLSSLCIVILEIPS